MLTHAQVTDTSQFSLYDRDSYPHLGLAAVLPEQFFSVPNVHVNRPEVELMRAVLEEALTCFQYQFYIHRDSARRLARDAEAWFFSEEDTWPFAFVNICTVLQLDSDYIRRGLRQWQANWPLKIQKRKRRTIRPRRPLTLAA